MPSTVAAKTSEALETVDLGVLEGVFGFRLRRIQNHLTRGFTDRLAGRELRPGVFTALALIDANPGLSQTALASEIGFDKATVVAIVDSLEALGWAERRQAKTDRRRRALEATAEGRSALTELQEVCLANEARARAALTATEQRSLFDLLDRIYDACSRTD
jgi:DNA-binding MarR family transcriptional regulator